MSTTHSKAPSTIASTDLKPHGANEQNNNTPPTTPTATSTTAHQLFTEIYTIHNDLKHLDDLAPGEKVNSLLTRLVDLCTRPYDSKTTEAFLCITDVEALCPSLRSLCARAEGELEKHWAANLLRASETSGVLHTKELLQRFPYYQNYVDLSRLESSLLNAFLLPHTGTSPLKIAFVGSGPLPLTSFCLLDTFTNATIHNIDRDVDAISQSKELSRRLGYGERMTFACEDAHVQCVGGTDWKTFDVVFLAALVGMTSDEKKSILQGLGGKLKKGCLIVCRSARGLRSVLYPILELSDDLLSLGYEIFAEVHPWTSVVNSVVVLRLKQS